MIWGVILGVLAVVGFLLAVQAFVSGRKHDKKTEEHGKKLDAMKEEHGEKLDEIRKELQELQRNNFRRYDLEFPMGFVLFYADGHRTIFAPPPESRIEIQLDGLEVTELTPKHVRIVVPRFRDKKTDSTFTNIGLGASRVSGIRGELALGDLLMTLEVVDDDYGEDRGAVLVLGWSPIPPETPIEE